MSTGGCTKRVHNNSLNNINNSLNTINNNFNSSSNPFNMEQGEIKTEEFVQDGFDSVSVVDSEKHTTTIDFDVKEIIQFWDENNFGHSIHSKTVTCLTYRKSYVYLVIISVMKSRLSIEDIF